jgi:predicted O-linked N-acetylglucosamine transferase (SPINDLY family)
LRNGYPTFGCFQNLAKINDEVLAVWGKIFQKLPTARLRLQDRMLGFPQGREQMRRRLTRYGIDGKRVQIEKAVPREEYLAAHAHVDIILDTFPFPGGTTTCEALWMGVPTITLCGNTMLARQGASLLTCAGMGDWIARDTEEYISKAAAHAGNLENLSRLRAGLRGQVLASPLFNGLRFARNFEAAMWGMWQARSQESGVRSQR